MDAVYPHPFHYHRATSVEQAAALLSQLGGEARLLAGGQSLIPLMKMRLARPSDLVDINFLPGLAGVQERSGELHFRALARHSDIEASEVAARIPIIHDCAAGIADVQVRNQGTIGGSLAVADPSGDWAGALLTRGASVRWAASPGEPLGELEDFLQGEDTTVLWGGGCIRGVL